MALAAGAGIQQPMTTGRHSGAMSQMENTLVARGKDKEKRKISSVTPEAFGQHV